MVELEVIQFCERMRFVEFRGNDGLDCSCSLRDWVLAVLVSSDHVLLQNGCGIPAAAEM